MKKLLLVLVAVLGFAFSSYAQSDRCVLKGDPTGSSIYMYVAGINGSSISVAIENDSPDRDANTNISVIAIDSKGNQVEKTFYQRVVAKQSNAVNLEMGVAIKEVRKIVILSAKCIGQ